MQTVQVKLTKTQSPRQANTTETSEASTGTTAGVLDAFFDPEPFAGHYARLAHKQARWHTNPQNLDTQRLDLIYHSEALEGSPLNRSQIEKAIQEPTSQ